MGINPGIKAIWDDEIQRRKNRGESSVITPPPSQGKCCQFIFTYYLILLNTDIDRCLLCYIRTKSDLRRFF